MSSGLLFDTNVLIDIISNDPKWFAWSDAQLASASGLGLVIVNPIIVAEMTHAFASKTDLDLWLNPTVFERATLPYNACWIAGKAFLKYRKAGGTKTTAMPDFFIGAHAECEGLTIVTRDPARYRTYFPSVPLIVP
jgi:predicted nucleic acid-binding protein